MSVTIHQQTWHILNKPRQLVRDPLNQRTTSILAIPENKYFICSSRIIFRGDNYQLNQKAIVILHHQFQWLKSDLMNFTFVMVSQAHVTPNVLDVNLRLLHTKQLKNMFDHTRYSRAKHGFIVIQAYVRRRGMRWDYQFTKSWLQLLGIHRR